MSSETGTPVTVIVPPLSAGIRPETDEPEPTEPEPEPEDEEE